MIYLDMNIIADISQSRLKWVEDKLFNLKSIGWKMPYSPAHMEEIANIFRECEDVNVARKYISRNIQTIRKLSDDMEFLPTEFNGISVEYENPVDCFNRVMSYFESTLNAERIEEFLALRKIKDKFDTATGAETGLSFDDIRKRHKIIKIEIMNIPPEKIFSNSDVISAFTEKLKLNGYEWPYKKKFADLEGSFFSILNEVTFLLNFLEEIGFYEEKFQMHRSRMHDVSHAIYGTKSSFFVTGDKRSLHKIKAIYNLLGVPTIVLSREDFKDYDFGHPAQHS